MHLLATPNGERKALFVVYSNHVVVTYQVTNDAATQVEKRFTFRTARREYKRLLAEGFHAL